MRDWQFDPQSSEPLHLQFERQLKQRINHGIWKPGSKIMTRDNHYAMQSDNVCPPGCVQPFGAPTPLESVIGYLREAGPRRAYMDFRTHARR